MKEFLLDWWHWIVFYLLVGCVVALGERPLRSQRHVLLSVVLWPYEVAIAVWSLLRGVRKAGKP